MTDFLTSWGVVIALACAACALVYGITTSRWLLALSPGNERMREISAAVQEGAKAYLNRQFRTLGVFLGILTVALFFVLPVPKNAIHAASPTTNATIQPRSRRSLAM